MTQYSVLSSFYNFAQNITVSLPCTVKIFKTIWQLTWMFSMQGILRNFSLRWVSYRYTISQQSRMNRLGPEGYIIEKATSHYVNQWWCIPVHICVTRHWWSKRFAVAEYVYSSTIISFVYPCWTSTFLNLKMRLFCYEMYFLVFIVKRQGYLHFVRGN